MLRAHLKTMAGIKIGPVVCVESSLMHSRCRQAKTGLHMHIGAKQLNESGWTQRFLVGERRALIRQMRIAC